MDIKFPSAEDEDKNKVVITGLEDDAMDCKDHLLNLEEEYVSHSSLLPFFTLTVTGTGL